MDSGALVDLGADCVCPLRLGVGSTGSSLSPVSPGDASDRATDSGVESDSWLGFERLGGGGNGMSNLYSTPGVLLSLKPDSYQGFADFLSMVGSEP